LPLSHCAFKLRSIERKAGSIRQESIDIRVEVASCFTVRTRRVDQTCERTQHGLRPHLIAAILLYWFDYRCQRAEWLGVVTRGQAAQQHAVILFMSQPQLFKLSTDYRQPAIHVFDVGNTTRRPEPLGDSGRARPDARVDRFGADPL